MQKHRFLSVLAVLREMVTYQQTLFNEVLIKYTLYKLMLSMIFFVFFETFKKGPFKWKTFQDQVRLQQHELLKYIVSLCCQPIRTLHLFFSIRFDQSNCSPWTATHSCCPEKVHTHGFLRVSSWLKNAESKSVIAKTERKSFW